MNIYEKAVVLLLVCLFAFSFSDSYAAASAENEKPLSIVCTTFPQYDWTRQILGDRAKNVHLTLLLDGGVDLHSYQPTAGYIIKIAQSDLFVYVGGESDRWVEEVLKTAPNPNLKCVNMLECVEAKEEETVEGMQEEEHDHDEDGHGDEPEYDEHVWLSLRNAEMLTQAIADALSELDSGNAAVYQKNAENYIAQLAELNAQYKDAVENGARTTILFADRFPFRYLADDYGLTYYAAFAGCSAETEASFETIAFLAAKADELALPAVMTIEGGDRSMAETVVSATKSKDQKILTMDSLQSITPKDVAAGENYLSVMTENLNVLKEALD